MIRKNVKKCYVIYNIIQIMFKYSTEQKPFYYFENNYDADLHVDEYRQTI